MSFAVYQVIEYSMCLEIIKINSTVDSRISELLWTELTSYERKIWLNRNYINGFLNK